jgi:hypothetical protein
MPFGQVKKLFGDNKKEDETTTKIASTAIDDGRPRFSFDWKKDDDDGDHHDSYKYPTLYEEAEEMLQVCTT